MGRGCLGKERSVKRRKEKIDRSIRKEKKRQKFDNTKHEMKLINSNFI